MYTRWARCAPIPVMTNTRPTLRPTAASFSPATLSPILPSSLNDFPLLEEGSDDSECEIEVHPERLRDVSDIGGSPTLEVPKDRRPCLRLGQGLHDDDTSLPEFVHVGLDRS